MKTSKHIRIGMMSIIALIALSFASKAVAAVNAYLYITDSMDKVTKVAINSDGTFQTPPLHAGTYSFSFGIGRGISSPTGGSSDRYSTSSGGDRPQESISINFTKIMVTYAVQQSHDEPNGVMTGKRQHQPVKIMKEVDKSSPILMTSLGTLVVDADCNGIAGKVDFMTQDGKKMAADDWHISK